MRVLHGALLLAALSYPGEGFARNLLVGKCENAGIVAKNIMSGRLFRELSKQQAHIPIVTSYRTARLALTAADIAFLKRIIDEAYEVESPQDYRTAVHVIEDFGADVRADCESFSGEGGTK